MQNVYCKANMGKILVTGGSGMVGSHLREILPEATYISSSQYDLTSESDVKHLIDDGWDHIVHLAARVGGILENIKFPAEFLEQNVLMNTNVMKYARLNKIPRVTAVLSTCIYPDVHKTYPMTEDDIHKGEPQATNFSYALSKRLLAAQIDAYKQQYLTDYNYLIPSNLYGEFDSVDPQKSHFLTALIAKLIVAGREGKRTIELLGTGRPLRQFMYAGDLAKVIKYCLDRDITDSFNVAPFDNLSIREYAELALRSVGAEGLSISFDESAPDGQMRKDVSNEKMLRVIPNFEFTPLETGIRRVFEYYKTNNIV